MPVSGDSRGSGLPKGAVYWLQANTDIARKLPHPEHEWIASEIDLSGRREIPKLKQLGIIKRVSDPHESPLTWQTDADAWRMVNEVVEENPQIGPCEHSGIRNLGNGEFTCTNDDCDTRFDRDIAESRV